MADRRRVNGPIGTTSPPIFDTSLIPQDDPTRLPRTRTRAPKELRKIFLRTNLTPSASGSTYLELSPSPSPSTPSITTPSPSLHPSPSLKLTCTLHAPRPLPRSAPFTPNLFLSTTVKFAPFATRLRRGYLRDSIERDLAVNLETALRSVIIAERWPKSGLELSVTVLEGEEDWDADGGETGDGGRVGGGGGNEGGGGGEVFNGSGKGMGNGETQVPIGLMSVLAGCITAASTALVDAGIDCVDLVTGGVAALMGGGGGQSEDKGDGMDEELRRVRMDAKAQVEERRVFVGNLAWTTTEEDLRGFFEGYGVESLSIPFNPRTARALGYAFVNLSTAADAQRAISQLSGTQLLNRKITVQLARRQDTTTQDTNPVPSEATTEDQSEGVVLLDPCGLEHRDVTAACVVAYSKARDEVTMIWEKSRLPLSSRAGVNQQPQFEQLIEGAVQAAAATQKAVELALRESVEEAS